MHESATNLPRRLFLKRLAALSGLVAGAGFLTACGENSTATLAPATATPVPTATVVPASPTSPASTTAAPLTTVAQITAAPTTNAPTTPATTTPATSGVAPAGFTALGSLPNFKEATNAPVAFKAGNVSGFVFLKGGTYLAYSNICTHQGCEVVYNAGQGNLICPCHGSKFSKEGAVTGGPARLNLADFDTQVVGTILYGKLK